MKKSIRTALAGVLSAALLTGCGGLFWLNVVQMWDVDIGGGKVVTVGDALDKYPFCRPNTQSWRYMSSGAGRYVSFSCRYKSMEAPSGFLSSGSRMVVNVMYEIPQWSIKPRLSRVWYTIGVAAGGVRAGSFELEAEDPEETLKEIALGKDIRPLDEALEKLADKAIGSFGDDLTAALQDLLGGGAAKEGGVGKDSGTDKEGGWTQF